jgi:hypothetical protein
MSALALVVGSSSPPIWSVAVRHRTLSHDPSNLVGRGPLRQVSFFFPFSSFFSVFSFLFIFSFFKI